jgi:hypothetical protein
MLMQFRIQKGKNVFLIAKRCAERIRSYSPSQKVIGGAKMPIWEGNVYMWL